MSYCCMCICSKYKQQLDQKAWSWESLESCCFNLMGHATVTDKPFHPVQNAEYTLLVATGMRVKDWKHEKEGKADVG